jgi:5-methylcytosine-specific restriction endonuclease McrA
MPRRVGKKDWTQWSSDNHDAAIPGPVQTLITRRANDICECGCGMRVRPGSGHVDHIIPLQDGGAHAFGNLQYLSSMCHYKKTGEENTARAKGNRVFAKTYGITKSKGRSFNRWHKKPKSPSGHWELYDFDLDGVPKRARWVAPTTE